MQSLRARSPEIVYKSENPPVRKSTSPKVYQFEGLPVRRSTSSKVYQSEGLPVRRSTSSKVYQFEGPLVPRSPNPKAPGPKYAAVNSAEQQNTAWYSIVKCNAMQCCAVLSTTHFCKMQCTLIENRTAHQHKKNLI